MFSKTITFSIKIFLNINCSNLIKNILNLAVKIDSIKSLNYTINFNKISGLNQINLNKYINTDGENIFISQNNILTNGKLNQSNHIKKAIKNHKSDKSKDDFEEKNKTENNNVFVYSNKKIDFNGINHNLINNNNIIINNNIINNNININNQNFNLKSLYNGKNLGNKIGINNTNFFYFNVNEKIINNCNNNKSFPFKNNI